VLYGFDFVVTDRNPVPIGPIGLDTYEGALPVRDGVGRQRRTTVPVLLSLNLSTGAGSAIGGFADRHDIAGLGWRSDGLLIGLDSTDNALLTIDPATVAVTTIKPVSATIGTIGGMALGEGQNVGFFATAGPQAAIAGSNSLYSFDPFTGDQVFIASFENQIVGRGISGLTFVPEPATLTLLCVGGFALLRRHATEGNKRA
jgi:hypothetical protein